MKQLITADPATAELQPAPFPEEWIARSQDSAMRIIAWSCTRGRFRWQYQVDEMLHILSGEVFITDETGVERRVGPGDTAFCPAGSWFSWNVTQDVRKVAVCHVAAPKPVTLALRIWNKICRSAAVMLGAERESALAGGGLVSEASFRS
jgi:uncharacterized cupin superfamily protein